MLTPMEIHNHEFKKGFRGYNENEVDDFLDQIVNDYEKVLRDNDKLRNQLNLNEKEINNYKNLEKNLQSTISVAQKTAEEIVAVAQRTADEMISAAKKNAEEIKNNAVRDTENIYNNTVKETQNIRENAKLHARKSLEEAARKLRVIIDEYEKIIREKNSFLMKVRTALESELAVTSHILGAVPSNDELSSLRSTLAKIESDNVSYLLDEKVSEPEKKLPESKEEIEEPDEKISEPAEKDEQKKNLIEKVTKVVGKVDLVENDETSEKKVDDSLDKTLTYKVFKK